MKKALLALVSGAMLIAATPAELVESPTTTALRYADKYTDGWPKWIGRLTDAEFILATYRQKPEMAEKYLPLSLIMTGTFDQLVEEVENTPGVDTSGWPSWIGKLRNN